jgi:hypothetical protein
MTTESLAHVLLDTEAMPWIPTGPGKSFKPIRFDRHGWSELMRVEPGAYVAPHHHTGEVHGYNISGSRELIEAGRVVGPGAYVYEPADNRDSWRGAGDEPCVIHITVVGDVEFYEDGELVSVANARNQQRIYLDWCAANGIAPHPSLAIDLT